MRPLLLLLTLLWALATAARAGTTPNVPLSQFFSRLRAGQKQTVVAYGTSLTKYGSWVKSMDEYFAAQYPGLVTVINSGGPGQNSRWGLKEVKTQVLDKKPDLVFIEFAYNDAHSRFKLPVEEGRTNLNKIVDAVRAQNPQVAIVVQTMNVPWDSPTGFKTGATDRPQLEAFNNNYRAYARENGVPLVDNYLGWLALKQADESNYQKMVPDGVHPNKNGPSAVKWPNIKALLEAARTATKP